MCGISPDKYPEKIIEKILKDQLEEYFEKHSPLSKYKSGFRRRYSCEAAITMY